MGNERAVVLQIRLVDTGVIPARPPKSRLAVIRAARSPLPNACEPCQMNVDNSLRATDDVHAAFENEPAAFAQVFADRPRSWVA